MAKYKVTVQYTKKASTVFETNDKALAKIFLDRELKKAKDKSYEGSAIFFNDRLKWRKR